LIGLIFIPLCKISFEVNDGRSIDKENHPTALPTPISVHDKLIKVENELEFDSSSSSY
jgi:hypothetical protein